MLMFLDVLVNGKSTSSPFTNVLILSFICLDGIEISTDVSAYCFAVVLVFDRRRMVSMFKLASLAQ